MINRIRRNIGTMHGVIALFIILAISLVANLYFVTKYIIFPHIEIQKGLELYALDESIETDIVFDGELRTGNDGKVDMLFVGNSITYAYANYQYWWGSWGGCATIRDNDYAHILSKAVSKRCPVRMEAMGLSEWETKHTDRAEMLLGLEGHLRKNLDYVIVFLGENIGNTDTLQADFEYMIEYIGENAPDAQILIIGQFWEDEIKDKAKKNACDNAGATFVDLTYVQNKEEYQCGLGTVVLGDDGQEHIVEHPGVAIHPGDVGMEEIARLIAREMD